MLDVSKQYIGVYVGVKIWADLHGHLYDVVFGVFK